MVGRTANESRVVARLILQATEDPENSNGDHPPTPGEFDGVVRRLEEIGRHLDMQLSEIVYEAYSVDPKHLTPAFRTEGQELFHKARVMFNGFVVERVVQTGLWLSPADRARNER